MNRLTILAALSLGILGAQTQVRDTSSLPSYKDLKFAPLPPLKIPEPVTFTLPDGMKIYLLENHELPIVSGVAIIRTGNLFDPKDKLGLAELTGTVLRSGGTKAKSGDDIDVELENIAASVESNVGESSGTLSFSCLRENTDEVMQLFHDFMTAAEFRQDRVDLAKTQVRSGISRRNDDPNGILSREFSNILYGRDTPYGWEMQYEHIDHIQRQDLVEFYHRYYFPANTMLGIYGDFAVDEMKARLEKMFADWTYKQPPVPKFPAVSASASPGVYLATKDDVTQTFFSIGHMGGVLNDKDYPALEVAADILGGGFSSRLFQRVRTKLGYAYNIGAGWGANYDHPGLFQINGSTQSRYTVPTIKAAMEELNRMRTTEVTDEELKRARDTVLNGFVFNFDRPSKTLNRMLIYEYYGYPKDFIFQYQKAVAGVTKADVLRVSQKYLRPQDVTIVAVGNPKEFNTPLTDLGFKVQPIDLTIPEPTKEAVKTDAASASRGTEMLNRMRTAMGGAAKLSAVKDVEYSADVELHTPGASLKGTQHNIYLLPSTMRQQIDLPVARQTVYADGTTGWIALPNGVQPAPAPVLKQVQGETFRLLYHLVMLDNAVAVDPNTVEISDDKGDAAKLTLDPQTGLPAKMSYQSVGMSGPVEVEETYSDWRDVNGIKVPYGRSVTQGGQKFADVHVKDFKFNTGVKAEDLSKKP
ncbi:MAG TPA: pitrilysin family protein [Bryobacteraceae bacterium]|nr:pitrilysin family protein [Bryobacteraceae bacterium]